MRVFVVGSGAREHALTWALSRSPGVDEVYAAPGNPGIAALAQCVPIPADAIVELAEFASSLHIDLTVVGPELPLVLGIADEFARRGLPIVGPTRAAAELEASKVFTKEFALRHNIRTASATTVRDRASAAAAVRKLGIPVVFKADGLASGKGVVVCHTKDDVEAALARFFDERTFGAAGERVLIEECLKGDEVSFMVLTDGSTIVPLASARDYKRLEDGDRGPNTGGMGAISPAPVGAGISAAILKEIVQPTIAGMAEEGRAYRGVLYAGVMVTESGPMLLEYNCRMGDPETQAILPRFDGDLLSILRGVAGGDLAGQRASWRHEASACVVLASAGYPAPPHRGEVINGLAEALALPGVLVFHAGTKVTDGRLVTSGGRVLSIVGRGATQGEAVCAAYEGAAHIQYAGKTFRRDIGGGIA